MQNISKDDIRVAVRDRYATVAREQGPDCGCSSSCCTASSSSAQKSMALGYSADEVSVAPDGANLGLGCGNPQAIASLKPGEKVLDLGSGGGFDCFLAARAVGEHGQVIGVDMTPEMIVLSRKNAAKTGYDSVEFRLGEIEHLPVSDSSIDVIISNCVINLSPDKPQVFRETFRVLKSGGRLAVSDMVAAREIPESMRSDLSSLSACISGASSVESLHAMLQEAGFATIRIQPKAESRSFIKDWAPGEGIEDFVLSATIEATKP